MFKILNSAASWTETSLGIWVIDLGSAATHGGYTMTKSANVGFLVVDGVVKPALKFSQKELHAQWDFYCDRQNNSLYVASAGNPTTLASHIQAAPSGDQGCIVLCKKGPINIHDMHITGTGAHGIWGGCSDVRIHDCLIDFVGGSELDGKKIRYGNGIESWVGSKRWLIENNEITQVYDVAWTAQGPAESDEGWEDLVFRYNHVHDCTQSLEFWSGGAHDSPGYQRIVAEGNIFERAGLSVFSDIRPDQTVRVHLLTYQWQAPADITIRSNVFDDAFSAYSYHAFAPVGLISRDNAIRLRAATKLEYQRTETVEKFAEWQNATGREAGSFATILA
jgi:hypothetical protein